MYLAFLTFGLIFQYVPLYVLFCVFFSHTPIRFHAKSSLRSLAYMAVWISFVYWLNFVVFDPEGFGNRVLHALGGGFLSYMTGFYVVRDAGIRISRFQFFIFTLLLVTSLGVMNELIEFFGQSHSTMIFADSVTDTWKDLTSNSVGLFLAAAVFTPFIKRDRT